MTLGSIIKNRRQEKGLSLQELSSLCGLAVGQLSLYENSKILPTPVTLNKIATALDMDYDEAYEQLLKEKNEKVDD